MMSLDKEFSQLRGAGMRSKEATAEDTPRTKQREEIRQKRLAYFERQVEGKDQSSNNPAQMSAARVTELQPTRSTMDAKKTRKHGRHTSSEMLQYGRKNSLRQTGSGTRAETFGKQQNEEAELKTQDKLDDAAISKRNLSLPTPQTPSKHADNRLNLNPYQSGHEKMDVPYRKQSHEAYWVSFDTDTTQSKNEVQGQTAKELLLLKQEQLRGGEMDWANHNILSKNATEGKRGDETYRVEVEGNIRKQTKQPVVNDIEHDVSEGKGNKRHYESVRDDGYLQKLQTRSSQYMDAPYGTLECGRNGGDNRSTRTGGKSEQRQVGLNIGSHSSSDNDLLLDIWGLKDSVLSGKLDLGNYKWSPTQAGELTFTQKTQVHGGTQGKGQLQASVKGHMGQATEAKGGRQGPYVGVGDQVQAKADNVSAHICRSGLLENSQTESEIDELGLKTHRPSDRPISPVKVTSNFGNYTLTGQRDRSLHQMDQGGKVSETLSHYVDGGEKCEQKQHGLHMENWLSEGSRRGTGLPLQGSKPSPVHRAVRGTSPLARRKETTMEFIRRSWDKNDFQQKSWEKSNFQQKSPPPRVHQRRHSSHSKTSSSPERHVEAVRFYVEQKLRKSMEEEQVAREGSVTGEEESRTDFVARWVQSVESTSPEDSPKAVSPRLIEATIVPKQVKGEDIGAREAEKEDPQLSPVSRTLKNLGLSDLRRVENPTVGQDKHARAKERGGGMQTRSSDAHEQDEGRGEEPVSPLLSPVSRTLRKLGFGYLKGPQEGASNKGLLVKICPNCTGDNDLDAAWCTECGSALLGIDSSPSNHHHGDMPTPSNSAPGSKDVHINNQEVIKKHQLSQAESPQVTSSDHDDDTFPMVTNSSYGNRVNLRSSSHSDYAKPEDSFRVGYKEASDGAFQGHGSGNVPTRSGDENLHSASIGTHKYFSGPTLSSNEQHLSGFHANYPVPSYSSHEQYPLLSQATHGNMDLGSNDYWGRQGSPAEHEINSPEHAVKTLQNNSGQARTTFTASTDGNTVRKLPPAPNSDQIILERSRAVYGAHHGLVRSEETDNQMLSYPVQFPSREELHLALDSSDEEEHKAQTNFTHDSIQDGNVPVHLGGSSKTDAKDNGAAENQLQQAQIFALDNVGVAVRNTEPHGGKDRHDWMRQAERTAPQLQPSKEPQLRKAKQRPHSGNQGASYITQGYKRHWQKSSIAWDSYNPGELNTMSSVVRSGEKRKMSGLKQKTVGFELSAELASSTSGDSKQSRRRPASAGQRSTGGQGPTSGERSVKLSEGQRPWSASRSSSVIREEDFLSIHSASFSQAKGVSKPVLKYHLDNQTYAKILTMTPRGGSAECPWLFLPDELLLYILSFLPQPDLARVATTCQHFHRVAMDESLWRTITLSKRTDLSDEMLGHIGHHSPQTLRLLQCSGTRVTERGLRELFKGCKDSLKELNFSGCSGGALTGDLVLLHASSRCCNIVSLDASWSNATNNGAMAAADISKRLEVLCVNGCQTISDEALNYVVNRHGDTLQVLEIFGCFNITQQCLLGIAQNCPHLRVLNMGQCYKVTDKLIRQMASKLSSLEVWDLRGCKQVQDQSVHQIVRSCSRLQTVTLANCPQVTDVALVEIATYLPNIRCIDVSGCRNVTDSGVRAFANNSKQLTSIDLSSTAISNRSVTLLASYCNRTLEIIKLSFCDITESAVVKLAKNCPRLHTLHVIGCKRIRNDGAIKVANSKVAVELGRKR